MTTILIIGLILFFGGMILTLFRKNGERNVKIGAVLFAIGIVLLIINIIGTNGNVL